MKFFLISTLFLCFSGGAFADECGTMAFLNCKKANGCSKKATTKEKIACTSACRDKHMGHGCLSVEQTSGDEEEAVEHTDSQDI